MDPNATLALLRALYVEGAEGGSVDPRDTVEEFHEAFHALDSWLSRGGFLPDAWESEADFTGARPHHNPDEEDRRVDERGPNHRFQMYTREGNDAVALMVAGVVETAQKYALSLPAIKTLLHNEVAKVEKVHPEIHDTEPRNEILDVMDKFLDEQGYARLEYLP